MTSEHMGGGCLW